MEGSEVILMAFIDLCDSDIVECLHEDFIYWRRPLWRNVPRRSLIFESAVCG